MGTVTTLSDKRISSGSSMTTQFGRALLSTERARVLALVVDRDAADDVAAFFSLGRELVAVAGHVKRFAILAPGHFGRLGRYLDDKGDWLAFLDFAVTELAHELG